MRRVKATLLRTQKLCARRQSNERRLDSTRLDSRLEAPKRAEATSFCASANLGGCVRLDHSSGESRDDSPEFRGTENEFIHYTLGDFLN